MSSDPKVPPDLLGVYEVMLREVGGYSPASANLVAAMPVFEGFLRDIRRLDELNLDDVEPAATFTMHHAANH